MNTTGVPASEILAELDQRRATEPDVHAARLFGLVYPSGREDLEDLFFEVHRRYLFHNALNPFKFPEIAALEKEVVAMTGALLHAPESGGGTMTSGGTESILMSMLVSRERAIARGIARPQIVAPYSAHPAYAKAAHYFGMELISVPLDAQWRVDVREMAQLIGPSTAVLVASAISYPHGVMDPVADVAALAGEHGVGCHVDACVGGFVLPFLERLGRDVPPWDFRVDGVTEVSADVHKFGYVPKGASVIMHRDPDWQGHQMFLFDRWPAGLYGSPAVMGARPAAPIATAWAAMRFLGLDGYTQIMGELMATVEKIKRGFEAMAGVDIVGEPIGPVLALDSSSVDLYAVADVMDARGWNLNRNVEPRGLHMVLSPAHASVADELLADFADAVAHHGESKGVEARYS